MNSPIITVLMPVYRGEKYIREAIDSILNQTFKDFELLIILDNNPMDSSKDIIKTYTDKRIRLIENKGRLGLTKSLNKGLRLAKGKYIARMDADDILYPIRLEVQYEFMEKCPDVGIAGSWNDVIDGVGNIIEFWKCNYSSEDIYYILNFRNCLTHCSTLFRKHLIITHGGYNETAKYAEDYDLWNRISKVAKICQIPEPLVKWRRTDSSISSKKRNNQMEAVNNVVRDNLERLTNEKVDTKIVRFIRYNFDKLNLDYLDILTRDELLHSIEIINKINKRIIGDAPFSLDKANIRKIADNKLINYIYIVSLRINLLDSAKCLSRYVNGDIWLKTKIIMLIVYRKLKYFARGVI